MTSRRRSKTLISLLAMASVGALAASKRSRRRPCHRAPNRRAPKHRQAAPRRAPVAWVRSAAAAAAPRTARTRTRATRSARSASPGTTRCCRSTTTRSTPTRTANTNVLYLMDGGFTLLRRRPAADQQRPVRHVHDRLARPADDHLPDQRGGHVVRRRPGRRRRHAPVLGGRRARVFNDENTVTTPEGVAAEADENGMPIVVGPDGAEITSVDEEAYAAAFDPETGALLEGFTLQGVGRRGVRRRRPVRTSSSPSCR